MVEDDIKPASTLDLQSLPSNSKSFASEPPIILVRRPSEESRDTRPASSSANINDLSDDVIIDYKDVSDEVDADRQSNAATSVVSCDTDSLLSTSLAQVIPSPSPIPSYTGSCLDDTTSDIDIPRPVASSSPYMIPRNAKNREPNILDTSLGNISSLDQSWTDIKERLGDKAQPFLDAFDDQDEVQYEIEKITGLLDDIQNKLDTEKPEGDIESTIKATQAILDDINSSVPILENLERKIKYKDGSVTSRDALNTTVSMLYDRWDTLRMQATSKQLELEIQVLENEQYNRMVQAYKVELSEVNDWMQETRSNIEQQEMIDDEIATIDTRSESGMSEFSTTSSVNQLLHHLHKCRNTVNDIERKLALLRELTEKGSLPSRTDDEGVKLLHEINSVQHQLKSLHKDEQDRAKKIKNALTTKQDEFADSPCEAIKIKDWLKADTVST